MNLKLIAGLTAAALALGGATALAQMKDAPMQHGPMQHGPMQHGQGMHHGMHGAGQHGSGQHGPGKHHADKPKGDDSPSSAAFRAINQKMHDGMDIAFTGNADVDFVRGMIPHHQGAVDMARTVLAFGKDSQIRKLAEEIVKAQESEIALMQDWLSKNAK